MGNELGPQSSESAQLSENPHAISSKLTFLVHMGRKCQMPGKNQGFGKLGQLYVVQALKRSVPLKTSELIRNY
jgi:hypothetical protein